MESAENVLKLAVEKCPASEKLWLLLIRLIYIKEKDTVRAREQLEEAMKVNQANPPFLASSNIWLTAFQVSLGVGIESRSSGRPTKSIARGRFCRERASIAKVRACG